MRVFLSGPMGVGKTTVGRRVAAALGAPFLDLDEAIEARAGASIAELFRARGERVFRRLEAETLEALLAEAPADAVVALGGGTVAGAPALRHRLLFEGVVVTLRARPETSAARAAARGAARPLLADGDPAEVLRGLASERRAVYAESHGDVSAEGAPDEVARAVLALVRDPPVVVPLGERTVRVEIGVGVRGRLGARVAAPADALRVLVTDAHVDRLHGAEARALLGDAPRVDVVLPPGEAHKDLGAVERVWDAALAAGADRDAWVVAFGGGVVGDVAGFAAATLLRGVALAQVPTTLLAMVDSSVGGKTGVDRGGAKNLIGAFHQPRVVLCDPALLATLPPAERIAGLAEVVKAAWLDGEAAVAALEADAEALRAGDDLDATTRAIRRAVALKARVVAADEREGGVRRLLNLGHTVGHALEAADGLGALRHGEAVALGLVAAFDLAVARGLARPDDRERARRLLERLGLPTDFRPRLDARVLALVARDKKRVGDDVRFVFPGAPGAARIERVALAALEGALLGAPAR